MSEIYQWFLIQEVINPWESLEIYRVFSHSHWELLLAFNALGPHILNALQCTIQFHTMKNCAHTMTKVSSWEALCHNPFVHLSKALLRQHFFKDNVIYYVQFSPGLWVGMGREENKTKPKLKTELRNWETKDISEKRLRRKSKAESLLGGTRMEAKMWVATKVLKPVISHEAQWGDKSRLERPVLAEGMLKGKYICICFNPDSVSIDR